MRRLPTAAGVAGALAVVSLAAQQTAPLTPDIPPHFDEPTSTYDYVKREVMIPMRDGVKLHTVIVVPRGARNAPLLPTSGERLDREVRGNRRLTKPGNL